MLKPRPLYTWNRLDAEEIADGMLDLMSTPQTGTPVGQQPARRHNFIYELFFAFVVMSGLTEYFLWQKSEARMRSLQHEVQEVHDALVAIHESEPPATISMTELDAPTEASRLMSDATALNIASPAIIAATGYGNPKESVRQELFGKLAQGSLAEAIEGRAIKRQWWALVDSLELHIWREQIFVKGQLLDSVYLERRFLARDYSIDLALQAEPAPPSEANGWTSRENDLSYIIADPLVEYILVTYEHQVLPDLLDGFTQYEGWNTLIPAVFNIPVHEFEEKWYLYLDEHYPPGQMRCLSQRFCARFSSPGTDKRCRCSLGTSN